MLDVGAWGEFIVILILALIIIGPKDLPKVMLTVGKWMGKIRDFSYHTHNAITMMAHPFDESQEPSQHPETPSTAQDKEAGKTNSPRTDGPNDSSLS